MDIHDAASSDSLLLLLGAVAIALLTLGLRLIALWVNDYVAARQGEPEDR